MKTPARILRAIAQDKNPNFFTLNPRQQERENNFVALATRILAAEGTQNITFAALAIGLRTSVSTLRFHFPDLHVLLAEILRRHLRALAQALGEVPQNTPNRRDQLRAAYLAYTRTPAGALTEAHLLLVRDRHTLPPDLLPNLELTRAGLGQLLAADRAEETLALLDNPALDVFRIEGIPADRPEPAAPQSILPPPEPRPRLIDLHTKPVSLIEHLPASIRTPSLHQHLASHIAAPPPFTRGLLEAAAEERRKGSISFLKKRNKKLLP